MTGEKIGKRRTQQRSAVTRVIEAAEGPMSVNEIHKAATKHCRDIGIATVYRTIKILLEDERVDQVILADGVSRYELPGLDPHQFFLCTRSGRAYRVKMSAMPKSMTKKVPTKLKVKDYQITLLGTSRGR